MSSHGIAVYGFQVIQEQKTVLTWENRLALWLPGTSLAGVVLIATVVAAVYLGMVWLLGLTPHRVVLLMPVAIAFFVMIPRYIATHDALDKQLYRPDAQDLDPVVAVRHAIQCSSDQIRRSRVAGIAGVFAALDQYRMLS